MAENKWVTGVISPYLWELYHPIYNCIRGPPCMERAFFLNRRFFCGSAMSMDFMGVISDVNLNFFHGFVVQKANHFGTFLRFELAEVFSYVFFPQKKHTQTIHVWYISLHFCHKNQPNVGKYTIPGWYGYCMEYLLQPSLRETPRKQSPSLNPKAHWISLCPEAWEPAGHCSGPFVTTFCRRFPRTWHGIPHVISNPSFFWGYDSYDP